MKPLTMLAAAILLAAVAGCVSRQGGEALQSRLAGTSWELIGIRGQAVEPVRGRREPGLFIDPAKKTAGGFAGCNTFTGPAKIRGSRIAFGPLASTRKMCPDMSVEDAFLAALGEVDSWSVTDDTLLLEKDGEQLLRFEATYQP